MTETIKTQVVRELCAKSPDTPSLTLAKKLLKDKETKSLYTSVDNARTLIRFVRGKNGIHSRKTSVDESLQETTPRTTNPFKLPNSEEQNWRPFYIRGHKRLLLLAGLHIPYHHMQALTLAIKCGKKEKVDGVIIDGDMFDFYQLSRYDKDPRKRDFAYELECGEKFLQILQNTLKCPIYFKLGNHEERYEIYLRVKAPELLNVKQFKLEHLLNAAKYDCKIITDKRIIKANKLNIVHGHEFPGGFVAPVNTARGLYLKGKASAIQGHNHQSSEHTEPNMNEEIVTTWSLGCLCNLHPAFMPINKWNLGFAVIDLDPNGKSFHVRNKRIHDGKIL